MKRLLPCWGMPVLCLLVTILFLLHGSAVSIQHQDRAQQVPLPIASLLSELPQCSALRRELEQGKRGSGIQEPYMAEMRQAGVKRAFFEVLSKWQQGRPTHLRIIHRLFFTKFDGPSAEITDASELAELDQQGLTAILDKVATQRVMEA